MTMTIKNLLSNLNHSAIGSLINLIKHDRDRVNDELVKAFEDTSANDLAHLFTNLGNHCADFSNFSLFLHSLTLVPRANINFCANDLNVIISAIAENLKREDAIHNGASEHNKEKAKETIHYLLDGYKNPCQIDMLYQIGENRTLSDDSLEPFDTLFANHLIKDSCKHNSLKQNSHFYADIFRSHHLPQSFSIYLSTINEDYRRIEILFNTLSHSKRFSTEYAKEINKAFGNGFLKDLSHDEIHLNGNIATYLSVSSAIGEESILDPDELLTRISSGNTPALISSVLNSQYQQLSKMPFLANFMLENFSLLLKKNVKINAGGILALAQEENKLNLLWNHVISAIAEGGTEETSDAKDEIIVKLFSYFNTNFIQAGDALGVCAHLAEGILSRLDPTQYPEEVFRINGDDYLTLRRSVGPALDREECVRMKFINAKREILSEDLGL